MATKKSVATAANMTGGLDMAALEARVKKLQAQYRYHAAHNAGSVIRNVRFCRVAGQVLVIYEARDTKITGADVWTEKTRMLRKGEKTEGMTEITVK